MRFVQGDTFRPTARQRATTIAMAGLPVAGGIYALVRPAWYSGGVAWTAVSGLLLLVALVTAGDRTVVDAARIRTRRFLIPRTIYWHAVAEIHEAPAPSHRDGTVIVVGTFSGERFVLPAPVQLPALPDPRYPEKVARLVALAQVAAPPLSAKRYRQRTYLASKAASAPVRKSRWGLVGRVLLALSAVGCLVGVAGSVNSLHYNLRNAAALRAAPPCASIPSTPSATGDPWCYAEAMSFNEFLLDNKGVKFGFELTGASYADYAFAVFQGHTPILDELSAGDTVQDVFVDGDEVGRLTYHGQRIETFDSPDLNVVRSIESISTSAGLAALAIFVFFVRGHRRRGAIAQACLAGLIGYAVVSLVLTLTQADNPSLAVLPFFGIALGCARLVWTAYPLVGPPDVEDVGVLLWSRESRAQPPTGPTRQRRRPDRVRKRGHQGT